MNNKFLLAVIAVLALIIFLQRSCNGKVITEPGQPLVKTDTVWLTKDTVITKRVRIVKRDTVYRPGDSVFIADTNCDKLKLQFERLAKSYSVRNIHHDTLYLDSLGNVFLTDTVQYNAIQKRNYRLTYKIPVVTNTITKMQAPRRQLYLGGGLQIRPGTLQLGMQTGLLYKNKKDQVFGVYTLFDNLQTPYVGFSTYWKIKLK